ncbi:MAG: sugar ABC transporter permease [Spirochaetia bacterium]
MIAQKRLRRFAMPPKSSRLLSEGMRCAAGVSNMREKEAAAWTISTSLDATVRRMPRRNYAKSNYPLYFTFAALAFYVVFVVGPSIVGLFYSFTDWTQYTLGAPAWNGLDNFKRIFNMSSLQASQYWISAVNTVFFAFYSTVLKTGIGFLLALALSEKTPGKMVHRTILFIPSILSMLIIGILFKSILHPSTGILNRFLGAIGLQSLQMQWLADFNIALPTVIAVDCWRGIGYIMVILLAGLTTIPSDYYEAANLDGASYWQKVRFVTVPLMMRTIGITLVLNLIYGLRVFEVIYVLTNGGPVDATSSLYTKVYWAIGQGEYGVSTALSSMLFVLMVAVGYFTVKWMTRGEAES